MDELADGPSNAAGPLAVMLGRPDLARLLLRQLTAPNAALLAVRSPPPPAGSPPVSLARARLRSGVASGIRLVPLAIAAASAVATALANPYG